MVRTLLVRGMLVGVAAGILAFCFATVFGEPPIERAIAFEQQKDVAKPSAEASPSAAKSHDHGGAAAAAHDHGAKGGDEPELFSRATQSTVGLLTGVVVYGAAFGGIFALVFAFVYGRVGRLGPRATAALLALAGFVSIVLVPGLKYPANPPAVGAGETIGLRTSLYLAMIVITVAALVLAVTAARRLAARQGGWNATLLGGAVFIVIVLAAGFVMPTINEVAAAFPASVLWSFRIASMGTQAVLWATIGLLFGALTERSAPIAHRLTRQTA